MMFKFFHTVKNMSSNQTHIFHSLKEFKYHLKGFLLYLIAANCIQRAPIVSIEARLLGFLNYLTNEHTVLPGFLEKHRWLKLQFSLCIPPLGFLKKLDNTILSLVKFVRKPNCFNRDFCGSLNTASEESRSGFIASVTQKL